MIKKQSSVEWLIDELWNTPKDKFEWHLILRQAKEMHKEEIIETWYESKILSNYISINQYYNKTFGGQDNE